MSQKDIAKMLGVTRVTVTRALGDSPLVSADMKAQVRALCKEIGYHPHYSSKSLKSSETKVISIIRCDVRLTDLHSRWVSYLQEDAQKAGYMIRLDPVSNFDRILGEGSADGFVIFDDFYYLDQQQEQLEKLAQRAIPFVFLDGQAHRLPDSAVSTDNRGGAAQAAHHLMGLGHRTMAYMGVTSWGVGEERFLSFRDELQAQGLSPEGLMCIYQERWAEDVSDTFALEDGLREAIARGATAIFASSDLYAAGAVRMLKRIGLSVPKDISVMGYDDSLLSRAYDPPFTTVMQDVAAASSTAVEMLVKRIRTGETTPSTVVPAKLIVRESTALASVAAERR